MTGNESGTSIVSATEVSAVDPRSSGGPARSAGWARHVLAVRQGTSVAGSASITVALLGLSWTASYAVGPGAEASVHHLFWLPIAWAAFRLGPAAALATGLCAAVLSGPGLPATESTLAVVLRGGVFVAIGGLLAVAVTRLVVLLAREEEVAQREYELDLRRAALIRAVSHEFRTPLTVIKAAPELLSRDSLGPARRRQLIERLAVAGLRLERLVETVLAVGDAITHVPSRDQRQDIVEVRLQDLVDVVSHRQGGEHRVRFAAAPDAAAIRTVPSHLSTVLGNLVENALKFSPDGTPVEVSVRREGGHVEIVVRDHGPGISLGSRRDAFELFTQLDGSTTRRHGGLGLGLFCARQVGKLLAADVDITTARGGGTAAVVRLPQRRELDLALAA